MAEGRAKTSEKKPGSGNNCLGAVQQLFSLVQLLCISYEKGPKMLVVLQIGSKKTPKMAVVCLFSATIKVGRFLEPICNTTNIFGPFS